MMKTRLSRFVMAATAVAMAWAGWGTEPASAQQRRVYAAKFMCGEVRTVAGAIPELIPVEPGIYGTAINVHNPNKTRVPIYKKAVLLFNAQQPPTAPEIPMPPGKIVTVSLDHDWGVEIDCRDIRGYLLAGSTTYPTFIKGYVVLTTFATTATVGLPPPELDVVAAYTTQGFRTDSTGVTFPEGIATAVERVLSTLVP